MRECPFCTGSVPESAAKCKHCGEWLTADRPAPPPQPPGKDGVVLLGEAAKTGVAAYIVFAAIGLVITIIFILTVFVPTWNRVDKGFDDAEKRHKQFTSDWEKSRQEQEQRRKEFDANWNRNGFPGNQP